MISVSGIILTLLLGIACFFLLAYGGGRLVFWPIYRAAKKPPAPTQYLLSDIYLLIAQLALMGMVPFRLSAGRTEEALLQTIVVWFLLALIWWWGVRMLSRAEVSCPKRRGLILLVGAPLGYLGSVFLLAFLSSHSLARTLEEARTAWVDVACADLSAGSQFFYSASMLLLYPFVAFLVFLGGRNMAHWALERPGEGRRVGPLRKAILYLTVVWWTATGVSILALAFTHETFSAAAAAGNPNEPVRRATLLSRSKYGDYEKATFSFEFGLRDDPLGQARNDWDLLYGNGNDSKGGRDTFSVTMVTDDCSRILDLGAKTWDALGAIPDLPAHPTPTREPDVDAVEGHLYLVHTKDTDSDLFALFRVETLVPGDRCVISWKVIPPPKLVVLGTAKSE